LTKATKTQTPEQILKVEKKTELKKLNKKYDKLFNEKNFNEFNTNDFNILDDYITKSFDIYRTEELEGISLLRTSKKTAQFFKSFYQITKSQKKWLNIKDCKELFEKISGDNLSDNWIYIKMRALMEGSLIISKMNKGNVYYSAHPEIVGESVVLNMYLNEVNKILLKPIRVNKKKGK